MQLSKKQIDQMKHCIGLHRCKPYRRHGKLFYKPYRNYFDCGRHDDPVWSELADCGLAVDVNGQGWYELTKAGLEALSSAAGIHIYDDIAAFVPALPKRLYVIGPGIIDSAGDEAVFEEAAEKLEGVDHLVRIPKDLVVENIDEPTAIRNGIHELTNPWDFFDGIALLPGWEASEGVKLMVGVAEACGMRIKTVDEWVMETSQ